MRSGPPVCLDLSRLVSRVGLGPWTGVDRVEAAWMDRGPDWGLVRTRLGYALLDRAGVAALADRLHGRGPFARPDLAARLIPGLAARLRPAEADVRRLARATCARPRLAAMLRRHLPPETVYLNTGHSNLTDRVLGAWPGRVAVLVHDLIPLTHPQFQRPGTTDSFRDRMKRVASRADLVICNSAATEAEVRRQFADWGRVPRTLVALLGVEPAAPEPVAVPEGRYFVCLGTIEPRKNHATLLDAWAQLAVPPKLLILGRRGWANEAVFDRLDARPSGVEERAGLTDGQVTHLMQHTEALLFPSHAEGYGLPAMEAAAHGTPVIASDLPVFRELLGDWPVYLPARDPYRWAQAVQAAPKPRGQAPAPPGWEDHVNLVLSRL